LILYTKRHGFVNPGLEHVREGVGASSAGLTLLRGTGIRLGELLDLELDCVWDSPSHGSWLKVPLGKLATERTIPLDATTLAALDE
jgi:integrase